MTQRHSTYLATLAFLVLAGVSSQQAGGTDQIAQSSTSFRERMKQQGRDTTANEVLDSILDRPKVRWRRADLDPRLRHRIHLNAADVPRFPHDDPKLMDPRNWPATMTVEGALCSLTVYVNDGHHQRTWSRSVEDSGDAVILRAYYTDVGTDFHSHYVRNRGPSYDWRNGRLRYRSWTKGRGSHSRIRSYRPYPSGEIFTFMEIEKEYDAQGNELSMKWVEEVFARNGTLIGCAAAVNETNPRSGYWLGVDVGKDYYYRWAEALERSLAGQP
jgi:hypothetical protein